MYYIIGADGREYGPVTSEQLRQWIAEGRANAQSKVRAENSSEWKLLGEFTDLSPLLSPTNPPSSVASSPAPFSVTTPPKTNQMAIAGLVLGILSVTASCCCYGLPFNVVGIICSLMALSQISKDPLTQQGKGLAIAGLVLSIVSILMAVALLVFSLTGTDLLRKLNRH
jgi:hypothetical protein